MSGLTQEFEGFILKEKERAIQQVQRNYRTHQEEKSELNIALITEITDIILDNKDFESSITKRLYNTSVYNIVGHFLGSILLNSSTSDVLTIDHPFIQNILIKDFLYGENQRYYLWNYIFKILLSEDENNFNKICTYLIDTLKISEIQLIESTLSLRSNPFFVKKNWHTNREEYTTHFSELLLKNIHRLELKSMLISFIKNNDWQSEERKTSLLRFFIQHNFTEFIDDYISDYGLVHKTDSHDPISLNYKTIKLLLDYKANKYVKEIVSLKEVVSYQKSERTLSLYLIIDNYFPNQYHDQIVAICEKEINKYVHTAHDKSHYFNYESTHGGNILSVYSTYLLDKNKEEGYKRIAKYVEESDYIPVFYLSFLNKNFKEKSVPLLFQSFDKDPAILERGYINNYYQTLFSLLEQYPIPNRLEPIIQFSIEKATKRNRVLATSFLATYLPEINDRAFELIKGKKVDERITGALILSHSNDPSAMQLLLEVVEKERNDDTRDVLLETLFDKKFNQAYTLPQVKEMITLAYDRKKLNRWGEKWLDEEKLSTLYWKNGEAFTPQEIRFLFYRIKRAKGLETDIEAKQLIQYIDQEKSDRFVNELLQGFQDSNANSKFKYYLTIAGLIGGNTSLTKLHTLFRKTLANKRYKMCEHYVSAIAMIGTNKALRLLDMLSRKFANKRKNIGSAAVKALEVAAKEMNITKDHLGDRIIPDFGMEDSYKYFDVETEEHRAFIAKDFRLNFFNADNKLRKSIPKATDRETTAVLKQIQKDINEVVKTQQGKLEQFLINERKWDANEWLEYYYQNPIMLIYVQKLLWGTYDNNELQTVFYCDEDLSFYDINDDEVELETTQKIGIVHPIHMSEELLLKWKEKVYEINLEFEFPILDREVNVPEENEREKAYTLCLDNQDIPRGADYVSSFLEKRGWQKENGDGGHLWFHKNCNTQKIVAHPVIDGPTAWYQGGKVKATIGEIRFRKGYNEKVTLNDIPKVFYSEVISDLKALINA